MARVVVPVKRNIIIAGIVAVLFFVSFYAFQSHLYKTKHKPFPVIRLHGKNQGNCSGPQNVYRFEKAAWKNDKNICARCFDFPQTDLRTAAGIVTIFIYEPDEDIYISSIIEKEGEFELHSEDFIHQLLLEDPALKFVDVGANIGIYTLSIAKMGRKVLSIEALNTNLHHLCASVHVGNFGDNVTLVYNAISNDHSMVNLGVDKNNKGGTFVDVDADHVKALKEGRAEGTYGQVATVTMDDLLHLPFFSTPSKVIIKMDVEGFEAKVLEKASRFFEHVHVAAFQMEWEFHRDSPSGEFIVDFMTKHKYSPYSVDTKKPVDISKKKTWGYDVIWFPNVKSGSR